MAKVFLWTHLFNLLDLGCSTRRWGLSRVGSAFIEFCGKSVSVVTDGLPTTMIESTWHVHYMSIYKVGRSGTGASFQCAVTVSISEFLPPIM